MSGAGTRIPGVRLRSFRGLAWRSLRARRLRALLTAGGIVLGVGMVFGVLLLVQTIDKTFDQLYDSVFGRSDVVVTAKNGAGAMPNATYDKVLTAPGVKEASPQIFTFLNRLDERGKAVGGREGTLAVAGVIPGSPGNAETTLKAGRGIAAGPEVEVQAGWARKHGVEAGETLWLGTPVGRVKVEVVGLFEFTNKLDLGGYGMAVMPLPQARAIMQKRTTIDTIAVVLEDGVDADEAAATLRGRLGEGVQVETPSGVSEQATEQMAGLNVALYFFSGTALFVGGFLILNSFSMTVLQRMREIGALRALGTPRRMIARSVLTEAVMLGLLGGVLGLGLGYLLAQGLLGFMKSIGFPVSGLYVSAQPAVIAVITGLIATFLGALRPARRAGKVSPVEAMRGGGAVRTAPGVRRLVLGLLLFGPGMYIGGSFWFGDTESGSALASLLGVGATMAMMVGLVLLAPFVVMPLIRLLALPLRKVFPAEGRLAADATGSNPGRTASTAAALMVGLSVVVVNATMAASFVGAIEREFDRSFARDVTVSPIGASSGVPGPPLADQVRKDLEDIPEAGIVTPIRQLWVSEMPVSGSPGLLLAYDPSVYGKIDATEYKDMSSAEVRRGLETGGVVIGEDNARESNIQVGDRIALEGPAGTRDAPVVGIAKSLQNAGEYMEVSLATLRDIWGVEQDFSVAIQARSEADRPVLERKVDALISERYPSVEALSNSDLKANVSKQVDQQFGFFNAIVGIAVLISILGIVNTLSMSVIERTREIGVLRALGASRWLVRRTMADESLLIATAGTIVGVLAGLLIGAVWLHGIGGTMSGVTFEVPTTTIIGVGIVGVLFGLLASILPARRAAKLDVMKALTYE